MLLDAAHASLLIVDVQERLLPAMTLPVQVVSKCKILLQAAQSLNLPIAVSEQYPKGLGHTVPEFHLNTASIFEKISFSCWRDGPLKQHFIDLHEGGRSLVVVAGIEAHVCVLQTCVDLANAGFGVFAVADAMSSRRAESAQLAFDRMRGAGVEIVNTEMVVFELLEKAGTPDFKAMSGLIK
jgi:nicotinamidase-related amidase